MPQCYYISGNIICQSDCVWLALCCCNVGSRLRNGLKHTHLSNTFVGHTSATALVKACTLWLERSQLWICPIHAWSIQTRKGRKEAEALAKVKGSLGSSLPESSGWDEPIVHVTRGQSRWWTSKLREDFELTTRQGLLQLLLHPLLKGPGSRSKHPLWGWEAAQGGQWRILLRVFHSVSFGLATVFTG